MTQQSNLFPCRTEIPVFSIIIPVYNVAPYLRECLDSVLDQTYMDWEAICVDDGSTDGSGAILDAYGASDPRFRVVHQKNAGEGGARNTALHLAKGRYCCFLDGDDIFHSRYLETLAHGIHSFPESDLIRVELQKYYDGQVPEWQSAEEALSTTDISKRIDFPQFEGYIVQYAFRRDVVDGLTFSNLIHAADRLFLAQVLERAHCIVRTGVPGYGYRQRNTSAAHSPMTARRFLDADSHRMQWLEIISHSKKEYTPSIMHFFYRKMTSENTQLFFTRTPDAENRRIIFPQWMRNLRTASRCRRFSRHDRIALRFFGTFRSRCLMWIMFESRPWLRRHGIRNPFATRRK